jgi:DNA-binding MurR/RpiR family transcriptional regulator
LRVLRPGVRRIMDGRASRLDQLLDVAKRDVVVLFDIRRYSSDLAAFASKAAAKGATIVLFTDQWLSPISKVAKHVLPAHVAAPSIWDSSAGLMMLVEAALAAVARELGSAGRDRLAAIETLRDD